jgi:Carboxypeptidase regulatory-like domain
MRIGVLFRFLLCALLSLALPTFLLAQATASLGGRVTDASGAVIPGASVKLTLITTGVSRSNTTTGSGEYQFSQLAPGRYTLDVTAAGFGAAKKTDMDLSRAQLAGTAPIDPARAQLVDAARTAWIDPLIDLPAVTISCFIDPLVLSTIPTSSIDLTTQNSGLLELLAGRSVIGETSAGPK